MHISKYEILVFTLVGLTSHTVLRTGFLDISLAQYHKNTFSEPFTVTCSRCDDCQMSRFPLLLPRSLLPFLVRWEDVSLAELAVLPGGNCIKIGLPGKLILGYYFQENMTSRRPFLLLRISFPGRPIIIQFIPAWA